MLDLIGGLDQAIYNTVHDYVDPTRPGHRGAAALAPKLGVPPAVLSNRVNPTITTHKLGLAESIPLQVAANDFQILREYSAALGHASVKLPPTAGASDTELLDAWAEMHACLGEQAKEIRTALADRRITAVEVNRINTAGQCAIAALLGLMLRLEGLAQ